MGPWTLTKNYYFPELAPRSFASWQVDAITGLPTNLRDGFYKEFKFDRLGPDSEEVRDDSTAAVASCGANVALDGPREGKPPTFTTRIRWLVARPRPRGTKEEKSWAAHSAAPPGGVSESAVSPKQPDS